MKGKVFLDTNILVYCYSVDDAAKQQLAVKIASTPDSIVSTQVLQELCNTLSKKFKVDWESIGEVLNELEKNLLVQTNTPSTIKIACRIAACSASNFPRSTSSC